MKFKAQCCFQKRAQNLPGPKELLVGRLLCYSQPALATAGFVPSLSTSRRAQGFSQSWFCCADKKSSSAHLSAPCGSHRASAGRGVQLPVGGPCSYLASLCFAKHLFPPWPWAHKCPGEEVTHLPAAGRVNLGD